MVSFVDNYGLLHRGDHQQVITRERTFVVVKKADEVVCCYDEESGLYSFPDTEMVGLNHEPTVQFEISANIYENGQFICEKQRYLVFDVNGAEIENTPLQWCKTNDILVEAVNFNATQKTGFKNFLVRVR